MSRRSSRRSATAAVFPTLPQGTQHGLEVLVANHRQTVARMLDCDVDDTDNVATLCEKCAHIMKQQQLSASSFLARFFDVELLASQAEYWGKSPKGGSAATLGDRVAAAWAQSKGKKRDETAAAPSTSPTKKRKPNDDEKDDPLTSSEHKNQEAPAAIRRKKDTKKAETTEIGEGK